MIGCGCAVCQSTDPRDRRSRPSIFIEVVGEPAAPLPEAAPAVRHVLVDTSPDLRSQALARGLQRVDAILFTHSHADHIFGLDDVRRFNKMQRETIPCFGDSRTVSDLRRTFAYVFDPATPKGGGIPKISLTAISGPFCIGGLEVIPVPVMHGTRQILGYRIGAFAYLTDCSAIPDASFALLDGVTTLVIDALRERPHSTHFSVPEALAAAARIGAVRTYFTHICHDLAHAETCARLPAGVELAYDGLVLEIPHTGGR